MARRQMQFKREQQMKEIELKKKKGKIGKTGSQGNLNSQEQ